MQEQINVRKRRVLDLHHGTDELPNAQADKQAFIAKTRTFLNIVQAEDRGVVEGIYQGALSPLGTPGPLSWLERENHEFTQYLARRLCD